MVRTLPATLTLSTLALTGCGILPSEFNLSPLYRHRLDEQGAVLEMDVLWPLIHYEKTAEGGGDFRIRPFYRRVSKPDLPGFGPKPSATEPPITRTDHQFLWPLGRVWTHEREFHARLFPLFLYDDREYIDGRQESDWYFLFPFFWGGADRASADAPAKRYFGMFPLYLDAPGEFLTYDRLTTVLWPLYTRVEKDGRVGHTFLWPFIGFSTAEREGDTLWRRFLPLFNYIGRTGQFHRYSILWPFIHWSVELLHTDDPLRSFSIFPLFSWQKNERVHSWSFLWPFFRGESIEGKKDKLDILWPFFRWQEDDTQGRELKQWWLWPFFSRTDAKHQQAWSVLWPLIWWRQYDDPDGSQTQRWVVPFFKHIHRRYKTKRPSGPFDGHPARRRAIPPARQTAVNRPVSRSKKTSTSRSGPCSTPTGNATGPASGASRRFGSTATAMPRASPRRTVGCTPSRRVRHAVPTIMPYTLPHICLRPARGVDAHRRPYRSCSATRKIRGAPRSICSI